MITKNSIKFSLVALMICATSFGAENNYLTGGLQGGVSFANSSSPAGMSTASQTGFLAGVFLNARMSQLFSFQPEMMLAERRAELIDTSGANLTAKYISIEFPALLMASFGSSNFSPFLFAGPVAIMNLTNSFEASSTRDSANLSFQPRTFDFAADFGVGVKLSSLFANLRFSVGLVDFDQSHADWKSNGIKMLLGVTL